MSRKENDEGKTGRKDLEKEERSLAERKGKNWSRKENEQRREQKKSD